MDQTTEVTDIPVPPTEPIPKELQAKVDTIRSFAECHNILVQGQFAAMNFQVVLKALTFLRVLHETAIAEAIKDKGAWLVPELKEHMEKLKEASKAAPNATT